MCGEFSTRGRNCCKVLLTKTTVVIGSSPVGVEISVTDESNCNCREFSTRGRNCCKVLLTKATVVIGSSQPGVEIVAKYY